MFLSWTNRLETHFNSLVLGSDAATEDGARSPKLAQQDVTTTSNTTIAMALSSSQTFQLIAFLNISDAADNYPVVFQVGGGIVDDVEVIRTERANGNFDFYCIFPSQQTGQIINVIWSALAIGTGFGYVWIGPIFRLPGNSPKGRGAERDWEILQQDLEDAPDFTLGGQANASEPNVAEFLRFGFSLRDDNVALGVAEYANDGITLPTPTPTAPFTVDNDTTVTGQAAGAQTIATWASVLTVGKDYQLDYKVIIGSTNDADVNVQITSDGGPTNSPVIRFAQPFKAVGTDLIVGVDQATSNNITFQILSLREITKPKRDDDLRSIIRHVGSQRPVIFVITERELDWIERTAIFGSFTEIDAQVHIKGKFYERSFTVRTWM